MKPPVDETPTKEELEVARILCNLPKLVLEAESRRLPDFLRWGVRRRRSNLDDDSALLDPPPPPLPPPPSISPPPDGNDKRKDGDRGDAGGGNTSSPETPFSFPASGSDEPDGRPPRPPCSLPAKKFQKNNRHMEWVKEQNQLIASLSYRKAHLQRSIAEYKSLYQKLKEKNSWLQDLQSKGLFLDQAVRESMAEEGQRQRQRQRQEGSSGLAPLGPITLQSPATRYVVDSHGQRSKIQPPLVDQLAGARTVSPSVVAVGRGPEKAVLDLNASPQKEEEWERSSAYKAAISAQARKRRLEIQREKNNNCSSPPPAMFSMAHKMPRLR